MSDTIPEPIATAHKRMEFGFQRLTDNEATRLLECATFEFRRAERLQLALDAAMANARSDMAWMRETLAKSARLEVVNRWQRWALYASAVWWAVVIVLIALWGAYVS